MPELAEVETVRRVLISQLKDKTITDIDVYYPNIIEDDIDFFKNKLIGRKIVDMSRLGKFLIFNLDEGNFISHLRMEGKYFYLGNGSKLNNHIHVVFHLDDEHILCYQDVRKFGRMVFKTNEDLYTTEPLSNVGVDPILTNNIDIEALHERIHKSKLPIKTVLLDQSIMCGLGNIYVDEVLYSSHISPHRLAMDITKAEVEDIVSNSVRILTKAIECKGTTIRSYTSSLGVEGTYQNYLQVHTKTVCPKCGIKLNKDKIGGRSSYYCEVCQK